MFLRKTMLRDESNICKQALMNEWMMRIKGLGHECRELARTIGLPDLRFPNISKGEIKQAVKRQKRLERWMEVEASRKLGDRHL